MIKLVEYMTDGEVKKHVEDYVALGHCRKLKRYKWN